jgi:hypothetical protein
VAASLAVHAAIAGLLAWVEGHAVRRPRSAALETVTAIEVVEIPAATPAVPSPSPAAMSPLRLPLSDAHAMSPPTPATAEGARGSATIAVAADAERSRPPGAHAEPAQPRAGEAQPSTPWLPMRHRDTLVVPAPWTIGEPAGAPSAHELRPGILDDAPLRGGKPFIPGRGNPLGPGVVADGDGGYVKQRTTFVAHVRGDGSVRFNDRANLGVDGLGPDSRLNLTLQGHFDLTDALMRAHGEDPYRYEKERFLEETRDARGQMALADREDRFRQALVRMPGYLDRVWSHDSWTDAQRRRLLFDLWDEVAEDGDAALVHAGVQVRAIIEGFIRRRLPAGSRAAYTEQELLVLDGIRRSRTRFRPYPPSP